MSTNKKLNECPTNIKEALDWLDRLGEEGAKGCVEVIKSKSIIKGFNDENQAKKLCTAATAFLGEIKNTNGGSSYTSAYAPGGWDNICKDAASGGGKCCGSEGCSSCQASSGNCAGCCAKCPKQICARIFCLIVPVLCEVLKFLYAKCNNNNKRKQPQDQDKWTGKITENDIGKFFTECGFNTSSDLKDSTEVSAIVDSLTQFGGALNSVYTAISKALGEADSSTFLKDASNFSNAKSPNSICDLLLWLQFLPYSTNYQQVITKLKVHIPKHNQEFDTILKEFSSSIPMIFLFIEGNASNTKQKANSLFQHIATLSKCQYVYEEKYYKDPEKVVKMLVAAMPVLYWSIDQMKKKCTQGDKCQSSVKECDKMWNFLSLMGWKKDSSDSDHNIEGNMKCGLFRKYIEKELIGDDDRKGRLNEIKKLIAEAWKGTNGAASPGASSSPSQYLPRSIYEMLIWLMGLPVSDKFKELKKQSDFEKIKVDFTKFLFEVPNLFLTLNGDLSGLLADMYTFQGIGTTSSADKPFMYGSDGTTCLKIFSAIVAILYPVIRYLQERCNGNGQAFANGVSWQNTQINADQLAEFLKFMGFPIISSNNAVQGSQFHSDVLQPIFGDLTGQNGGDKLKTLYDVAKEHLKGQSSNGSTPPSTIRQMMLWLIGLPVTTQYGTTGNGLMSEVNKKANSLQNDLKGKINNGQPTSFQHQLQHSIVGMMTVISQIEGGLKSVLEFLKEGFKDNQKQFEYKSGQDLFTSFTSCVTSVHVQLRFLEVMCKTEKENGGWKICIYNCNSYATTAGIKCGCVDGTSVACNSTPLRYFLMSTENSNEGKNGKNMYKSGTELSPMGFNVHKSQSPLTGKDIYTYLKDLIDPIDTSSQSTPKPLSLLTQYCVAIGQLHPQSLGDLFAFFLKLGTEWENLKLYNNGQKFKDKLEKELNGYKIGNGGEQDPCDELKEKIIALFSIHTSHTEKDLMSLVCDQSTCSPYMKSLSSGLYSFYAPQITGAGSTDTFGAFQYIYDMLRKLLDKMKELKGAFDKCPCCTKGSCQGLIQCQYAHPILYKFGFVFGSPGTLKSGNKKCTDIKAQLTAVLSCTKNSESALFKAFECVIQVTYKVLLEKAKGCVTTKYKTNNGSGDKPAEGLKSTTTEMNTAFMLYVTNAMYQSYPTLICTFACKVFDGNHTCNDDCKTRFKDTIQQPTKTIPSSAPITVTSSPVTSIIAVIPQYTAPPIDPYHYRTFPNQSDTQAVASPTGTSTSYSFKDAIDFHVTGANCIRPTPVALRSVIDWILRITVGDTNGSNSNGNISKLSDAIKSVLGDGMKETDSETVQQHVTSLVEGLRTFMGYEDKSTDVINKVGEALGTNGTNGVKKLLGDEIKKIEGFIGTAGKDSFASELGKALLKGRYDVNKIGAARHVIGLVTAVFDTLTGYNGPENNVTFKDVVGIFTDILKSTHEGCKELKCNTLNNSASSQDGDQNDGLKILKDFLEAVAKFNQWTYEIGDGHNNKSSSDIVLRTRQGAEKTVSAKAMNGTNGAEYVFYNKLVTALTTLGGCHALVDKLLSPNGSTTSSAYRTKIQNLVSKLNEMLEALNINNGEKKDIPLEKVESANQALITRTKSNVENRIKFEIQDEIEKKYTQQNGQCALQSQPAHTQHTSLQDYICIQSLIQAIESAINSKCDTYKSHLDDLKQLCQWLYRMGQLYAHGLKGFVDSLIEHLEHILQVICWIEGIEKMITKLNDINKDSEALQVTDLKDNNDIKDCCTMHNGLYNSTKFSSRDDFFTALNCRIDNLLGSYVLKNSDAVSDDNSDQRRQLLHDVRLLALDRYTLQLWQDECNPTDNRPSAIKNWITFENGIIRHSDLEGIKQKLHELTRIDYSSNTATVSTPHATSQTPRSRIHDFHAICVIQKFSYEAPITQLESSLEKLKEIKEKLEGVKGKCHGSTSDVRTLKDDQDIQKFCTLIDEFLKEPYGIYNFAKFVHTILGPNIFSAVIGALEELTTEKLSGINGDGAKRKKFCAIVTTMCEGLESDKVNGEHYKLESIITKLNDFITTLRKEYIFCYPVVTCTAQQQTGVQQSQSQPQALTTASATTATGILDRLKTVMLPCPSDLHNESSICDRCYELFPYIFLGQVPKLYHSFRFMSWMLNNGWKVIPQVQNGAQQAQLLSVQHPVNKKITFYLVSMGYDNDKIQNVNPSPGVNTQLNTTFKSAVESFKKDSSPSPSPSTPTTYEPNGLKDIHEKLEAYLKGLLQLQHNSALKAAINSGKDPRRRPTTIREMLHWLSGVPFSVVYSEMEQFSNSLCDMTLAVTTTKDGEQKMKHTIQPEWISYRLGVSCAECLDVLQAVEDPLGKEPQKRFTEYIATHDFYYPANASQLFYMFVDVIYNVYVQMKFVCNMTGRPKEEGGWERCEFVRDDAKVVQQYNKHNIQCECLGSFVEHRCAGPLRRLLSSVSTVFTGRSLSFQLPKDYRYNAPVLGSAIHNVIKHIFGYSNNYSVLCRLLLAVSTCPPTSIGDMISFLYWYRRVMFPSGGDQKATTDSNVYKNALHKEIELFPGTFDASKLTGALGALMKAHGVASRTTSGTAHTHNLLSVMYCEDAVVVKAPSAGAQPQPQPQLQQLADPSVTCAPYLRPLAYDIYKIYVPQFSRAYLSWILHFGPRVYTALEELKGKLNKDCEHCKKDGSIVTCNTVLPELYSKGLDFYDPKVLNGQKKNNNGGYQPNGGTKRGCNALITQLGEVLRTCSPGDTSAPGAPLHRLIEAIEQFLWSIRLPFSLVQLSLWSAAVLFISYVLVVPLDHFKIKSHLFNRLKYTMHPSLLIADGQRKVSEVAYFSL